MKRFLLSVLLYTSLSAQAVQITHVRHDRLVIDPAKQETVTVKYEISAPSRVTLKWYDGRDILVRSQVTDTLLATGEHDFTWDGEDEAGRFVPPEVYRYTLTAVPESGEAVEYDLSDLTGGEDLDIGDVKWSQDRKIISYVIPKPARVNIRIGISNSGPLLRTLLNWVPRLSGVNEATWDAKDASGVLDLSKHDHLDIWAQAFSLSDNSIIVGPLPDAVGLIGDMPWEVERRSIKQVSPKRMYAHSQQPIDTRGDFTISLTLPDHLPINADGLPVVTGRVPVRLEISEKDRALALARRTEPVFFVDGQFAFEIESGFLPITWMWDTKGINRGVHYISANLRGYEGNFGIATLKVFVE
jgi:hypothetical protein